MAGHRGRLLRNLTEECTMRLERIKLRQVTTPLKLFPLDLLGLLIKTRRENLHLLVITDRLTKLTVTVLMSSITA